MRAARLVTTFALGATILGSAACALLDTEKETPPAPVEKTPAPIEKTPASSTAVHENGLRCSRCHGEGERAEPRWRDRARSIGHDLSRVSVAGGTTCECCHLGKVEGFQDPIDERCAECHDDIHVTIPAMGRAHCVSCHDFEHPEAERELREKAWECQRCHADAQGKKKAIDVHGGTNCSECHSPHTEPWVSPRDCLECHKAEDVRHTDKPVLGAQACEDCHRPHEKANEAAGRCATCHEEKQPGKHAHATFPGGHDACTTCHTPHRFDKETVRDCKECHGKVQTMGVAGRGAKSHADCESCHSPHDVKDVKANPGASCNKCHDKLHPTHPDPLGKGCVSCHDPHPEAGTKSREACSSCHEKAHGDQGFHKGVDCKRCHEPHAFAPKEAASCDDCHAATHARATKKPGHADCSKCHEKHDPLPTSISCDACHATEASTAPAGHQDCRRCHDPHDGSRGAGAACKACHAAEAESKHGKNGCADCHRAHGPGGVEKPPVCATCHETSKLPALHARPGHQTCSSCHSSHGPPKSDRKTCIGACHQAKMDHEPTARTCAGCHRFRTAN